MEAVLLRQMLGEIASRGHLSLQIVASAKEPEAAALSAAAAERFWIDSRADPCGAFREWIERFVNELARISPGCAAAAAARIVRQDYTTPWPLDLLAGRVGVSSTCLRRAFRQRTRTTVRRFKQAVRVLNSLALLETLKIEAVALLVGYRSKKCFYDAFRRQTGLSPHTFRSLPAQERGRLRAALARAVHQADEPPSVTRSDGASAPSGCA
jgi:transcriptional regulator GlxA family with amidase domain